MAKNIKLDSLRNLYFKLVRLQKIANNYNFNLRDEELEFIELMTCDIEPRLTLYINYTISKSKYKTLLKNYESNNLKSYREKLEYLYSNILLFQNDDDFNHLISTDQIKSLLKSSGKINSNIRKEIITTFNNDYPELFEEIIILFDFDLLKDIYITKNQDIINLSKEYHLSYGIWNARIKSEFELIELILTIRKYREHSTCIKQQGNKKTVVKSSGTQLLLPI